MEPTSPSRLEQPEQREIEPKEVARIFLFQSRTPDSIPDDVSVADLTFTNSVWMLKNDQAVNAGQIMPVGGLVKEGEDPFTAALRESVEETHLRPPARSIREFATVQEYEFNHPREGRAARRVHFYKGKLSAPHMDIPYVLDAAEDKTAGFVTLSIAEMKEITAYGDLTQDGVQMTLLDSLHPQEDARISAGTSVNETQRDSVMQEAVMHQLLTDARKKVRVLYNLINYENATPVDTLEDTVAEQRPSPDDLDDAGNDLWTRLHDYEGHDLAEAQGMIDEVDRFWRKYATLYTVADVRLALENSDFAGSISNAKPYEWNTNAAQYESTFSTETGVGIPSMTLIIPLLMEDNLNSTKIEYLERNPRIAQILRYLRAMHHRRNSLDEAGVDSTSGQLLYAVSEHDPNRQILHQDASPDIRESLTNIYEDRYHTMGDAIDSYFENLRDTAGLTDEDAPIDQLDAVKGVEMATLLDLASGRGEQFDGLDGYDRRVLRFEAARKLCLMLLLDDAIVLQNRVRHRGVHHIEAVEKAVFGNGLMEKYPELDVRTRPEPKELMSLLRKIIVRDQSLGKDPEATIYEVAKDVYASSYVVDGASEQQLEPHEYQVPDGATITDKKGTPLTSITAPEVVKDIMFTLLAEGGNSLSLVEYKPLPEPGKSVMSAGPGGGGKVRYAKFYIQYVNGNGKEEYKEVQVYVPDPVTGRSASDEYAHKKVDDSRYGVARLFGTKGVRSFMELLFPAQIYDGSRDGDVRAMYTGKKSNLI